MKIELTPAVVECLKRGLNCWPLQNDAVGLEIKEILAAQFKPICGRRTVDKDEVIKLAKQAGFADGIPQIVGISGFINFANLVAAAEREACAD
jgi:hypothetical protein